jgi:hypothetical protein
MCRPSQAPTLESFPREREERPVETYVILRRGAWRTPNELRTAADPTLNR